MIEEQNGLVERLRSVINSMRQTSFGSKVNGADEETARRINESVDQLVLTPFYNSLSTVEIKVETTEPIHRKGKPDVSLERRYDETTYTRSYFVSNAFAIQEDVTEGICVSTKTEETWCPTKCLQYKAEIRDNLGRVVERIEGTDKILRTWERFQYEIGGNLQQYARISFVSALFCPNELTQLKYKGGKPTEGKKIEFWQDERSGTIVRLVKRTSNHERWGCAVYQNPYAGLEYVSPYIVERDNLATLSHFGLSDVTPSEKTGYSLNDNSREMMYIWHRMSQVLINESWQDLEPLIRKYDRNDTTIKLPCSKIRADWTAWARPEFGNAGMHNLGMHNLPVTLTRVGDNFEIEYPDGAKAEFPRDVKIREYQKQLADEVLYKKVECAASSF